ncbi:hypothetical protein HB364_18775 [Pseudoflavitalea sp. X16]|uniref:hypothetical protein n=1 Tax=Paraflavitalea devenefica TaxID=2716334 RepID=UPI001421526D|nr:hypothetical protein [Paraflavitalea devenefica]NII27139.1 hypothetical protein [Paraflavitalea devenefica]
MKKMLLSFAVLLLAATAGIAQCDKNVVYHSDQQERISEDGSVMDTKTDVLSLEFTKERITVNHAEKAGVLTATIRETTCQWKDIYKEGKAIYKVEFQKPETSETTEGTMTVEAKEGKLHILIEMVRLDGKKIRLLVNRYEEK